MNFGVGLSLKSRIVLSFVGINAGLFFLLYLFASNWYANNQLEQLDAFLQTESTGILTTLSIELNQEGFDPRSPRNSLNNANFKRFLEIFLRQRANKPLVFKTTLVVADMADFILGASNEALNLDTRVLYASNARMSGAKTVDNMRLFSVSNTGLNYRIIQAPIEIEGTQIGTLRLACLLDPIIHGSRDFMATSSLIFLLTVILNSFSSVFLVTLILSPVKAMSRAVQEISERKLDSRLAPLPGKDELSMLALTFNHTLQKIENAYNLQEDLVNDLSHQLRTPLTSMRGAVEVALGQNLNKRDYKEILEGTLSGIDRITTLINTMLSVAKLEGNTTKLNCEPYNLPRLLRDIVDELSPLWAEKETGFAFVFREGRNSSQTGLKNLDAFLGSARASRFTLPMDVFRLKQAIINIFSNAYRHIGRGGLISVEMSREPRGKAEICRLVIANDGPPIPAPALPKLFERFFQAEDITALSGDDLSADRPGPTGFGLGLNISRKIVEMHQGKIRAYNPENGGAAFEICLPFTNSSMQKGA